MSKPIKPKYLFVDSQGGYHRPRAFIYKIGAKMSTVDPGLYGKYSTYRQFGILEFPDDLQDHRFLPGNIHAVRDREDLGWNSASPLTFSRYGRKIHDLDTLLELREKSILLVLEMDEAYTQRFEGKISPEEFTLRSQSVWDEWRKIQVEIKRCVEAPKDENPD